MTLFDIAIFDSVIFDVGTVIPVADKNNYTISAQLAGNSLVDAMLSQTTSVNAIISAETTYTARLN